MSRPFGKRSTASLPGIKPLASLPSGIRIEQIGDVITVNGKVEPSIGVTFSKEKERTTSISQQRGYESIEEGIITDVCISFYTQKELESRKPGTTDKSICSIFAVKIASDSLKLNEDTGDTLYSPKMGTYGNNDVECATCKLTPCPGHFGIIDLPDFTFVPSLMPTAINVCASICLSCATPFLSHTEISDLLSIQSIENTPQSKSKFIKDNTKVRKCRNPGCSVSISGTPAPKVEDRISRESGRIVLKSKNDDISIKTAEDIHEVFFNMHVKDIKLFGFGSKDKKFENQKDADNDVKEHLLSCITKGVIVIPPGARPPYTSADGTPIHDKLTLKLKAVVKARNKLRDAINNEKTYVVSTVDINNARLELDIAKARLGEIINFPVKLRKAKENISNLSYLN